ncbi:MAG: phytoene desaturase family protein [Spirochaeta sp.]
MEKKAVVIGSGIGGLSCAAYLAHAGCRVQLFEAQTDPGGKARVIRAAGYRFDTGPSIFTMQHVFAAIFAELDAELNEYLHPIRLNPAFSYWWRDGTKMEVAPGAAGLLTAAEALGVPRMETASYIDSCRQIYDTTNELFLWHSLHDPPTFFSAAFRRSLRRIGNLRPFTTMHKLNARFFTDASMQQFADRYATYNGSSPFLAPATLNIISYIENVQGAMGLKGGMYSIVKAFEALAVKHGAEIRCGTPVQRIEAAARRRSLLSNARQEKVTAVYAGDQRYAADIVVTNSDVERTYRHLLNDPAAPELRRYMQQEPSSSVVVWYLGVGRKFPQLGVNNIFFSDDYESEFAQIFAQSSVPADPTLYINITSKITPEDAPPHGENWFVLVNTPPDTGQDWDTIARQVYRLIIQRMSRQLKTDLEPLIEYAEVLTPRDLFTRTGSRQGSIYGISSNSRTAAFLRHANRSKRYRGLYFCGGSVHPGGGMPMVALSGRLAALLALRDAGIQLRR